MSTAAALATPILRNAAGEPPLGAAGAFFRDDQGEIFLHPMESYRTPATRIGVLELEGGEWLAQPPGFHVDGDRFNSREAALRTAIARVVRKSRKYMRNRDGEGTHWNEGFAGRVIEWALSLKPERGQPTDTSGVLANPDQQISTDEISVDELTIAGYEASDAGAGLSDPVVRYLVEQHSLRKQFPAKHIFSMTTEVADGRIVSVATCACKQVFKFGSNDYLRMNAAIEAHWRRFSHEKMVDGRGQPIGHDTPAKAKKPRKGKSSEGGDVSRVATSNVPIAGGDHPEKGMGGTRDPKAEMASGPSEADQPAQICASSETAPTFETVFDGHLPDGPDRFDGDDLLRWAEANAWREEPTALPMAMVVDHEVDFAGSEWVQANEDALRELALQEFQDSLPQLMGADERRRKVAEFKLALKARPVNLGPLFGRVPPPSTSSMTGRGND